MSGIISRIEYEILPRTVILKPQTDGEHRVMGWGVRPYAKGMTVSDWEQAYEQLMSTGTLEHSWFKPAMAECSKSGPCNFTMIGGVFALLGIAVCHGRGVYRKA